MKELSTDETQKVYDEIGIAANGLDHLPFAQLRKTKHHEFGMLRLWPKQKTFLQESRWNEYKWRPLVSFRKHRWRRVLSLFSRW